MNPLQTATLEELLSEIKSRSNSGVMIFSGHNPKDECDFLTHYWGSELWVIGACRYIEVDALQYLRNKPEIEE